MTLNSATNFVTMTTQNTQPLEELWLAFGRKVREYREQKGWSQEEAAKRAGMKRQQWNRIEQGASTKRATLLRIAEALGIDRHLVLDWAGFKLSGSETTTKAETSQEFSAQEFSSYVQEAVSLFNQLPDHQRKKLLRILVSIYEEASSKIKESDYHTRAITHEEEGSKVTAKAKEKEGNEQKAPSVVKEDQQEAPSVTLQGFATLEEAMEALRRVDAGELELVPIVLKPLNRDPNKEETIFEASDVDVNMSGDPSDPEPFKPTPEFPSARAKIIFPPTRPLKG